MLSNEAASSSLLILECNLIGSGSSSFEEFVNSSPDSQSESFSSRDHGLTETLPTLESLLNNLALDRPLVFPASVSNATELKLQNSPNSGISSNISSWLSSAFKWEPTEDGVNFVTEPGSIESKPIILYASKMKLIEKLTTILDYKFMDDVLLTVEMIMHPINFATCVLSRIAQAFGTVSGWDRREEIDPEVIKMRGLIVLQHWASSIYTSSQAIPYSIRKLVIEGIDVIWQHSRTLSQTDQRFLIRIRRLFDPLGEISVTAISSLENRTDDFLENDHGDDFDDLNSSVYGSEGYEINAPISDKRKWREKLKMKLKAIFSKSSHSNNNNTSNGIVGQNSSGHNSPNFLINSFSSDLECEDFSSFLIRERSKSLANILATLEWDLFSEIQRSELVLFPMVRESPKTLAEDCPNLQRAIEHFNSMCRWFVQLILEQDSNNSVALLSKLIRLAVKCLLIKNYNSSLQIILALQSPAISSLKEVWNSLPSWERRLAKDLALFGSPIKNFRSVRKAMDEAQREDAPAVPFTGLFLSDLVFNWERHSGEDPCHQLIPIYKNHVAAKILRQFIAFQSTKHQFGKDLNEKERQLYSYFADIGRLGGEFSI